MIKLNEYQNIYTNSRNSNFKINHLGFFWIMSVNLNTVNNVSGSAKKRKVAPTSVMSAVKPIDPEAAIVNITLKNTGNKPIEKDNLINYSIKSLLSEEGNLVLDYPQLLSSQHQQQHLLQQLQAELEDGSNDEAESDSEEEDNDEDSDDVSSDGEEKKVSEALPKKRVSKYKGKAMVGKYDLEDPFIDDSEHLAEGGRQEGTEGVGFFVFFGEFEAKDIQK
ncbi:hypothetical protein QEN19_000253 [Hanseniaspora menglaensis]